MNDFDSPEAEEKVRAAEEYLKAYCAWRQSCVCCPHYHNCHNNPPRLWDIHEIGVDHD